MPTYNPVLGRLLEFLNENKVQTTELYDFIKAWMMNEKRLNNIQEYLVAKPNKVSVQLNGGKSLYDIKIKFNNGKYLI